LLADLVAVLIFAAIGRHTHSESDGLLGVLTTVWPFAVGLAVGWAVAVGWRRRVPWSVGDAVPVWVGTVALGMVLRHVSGRGTPVSFVVVATVFLGLFLLGWRAAYRLVAAKNKSG
jgi:predicted anti-sigma-YlaC factor YlaD